MGERKPHLHKGHRARVKNQILRSGLDAMNDHQVAEAMLFFALPQGDTNELAHELINSCGGTLASVINTRFKDLIKIKGVGEHTAHFINFLRLFAIRYLRDSYMPLVSAPPQEARELCELFKRTFLGAVREEVQAAAFTANGELICVQKISEGGFTTVSVSPRMLLDFAAANHSAHIVIAHNHPVGSFLPSREDVENTADYHMLLSAMDVELADHIIIGSEGAYSMRSSMYAGKIWCTPDTGRNTSGKNSK